MMELIVSLLFALAADLPEQDCNWMREIEGGIISHTDRRLSEVQSIQYDDGMTLSREVSDNTSFRYCMTYRDARSCTDLSLEFSLTGIVERQIQTNNDQIEVVFLSSGVNPVALRYSCNEGLIAEPGQ